MDDTRRLMQQALQESLDRRDNGGPAGMVKPAEAEHIHGRIHGHTNGRANGRTGEHVEPPVSEWARGQLQHAFN
jgi:hypothetical protein